MTSSRLAGDHRERLTHWVREHAGAVRGFLRGITRRADVADDLLQETFRRAWQARDRYEDEGRERSYLLRIADRLAVDYARRNQLRETTVDDATWQSAQPETRDASADWRLSQEEDRKLLAEALEGLSEAQRRVLLMRFYGDFEFAEIARQMECPLGTVLSHCHRALSKLRKQLAGYAHE